jgi:hypothetical protein
MEGGKDKTRQFGVLSKESTGDGHQFATGSGAQKQTRQGKNFGSEGCGFESLQARSTGEMISCISRKADDNSDLLDQVLFCSLRGRSSVEVFSVVI